MGEYSLVSHRRGRKGGEDKELHVDTCRHNDSTTGQKRPATRLHIITLLVRRERGEREGGRERGGEREKEREGGGRERERERERQRQRQRQRQREEIGGGGGNRRTARIRNFMLIPANTTTQQVRRGYRLQIKLHIITWRVGRARAGRGWWEVVRGQD